MKIAAGVETLHARLLPSQNRASSHLWNGGIFVALAVALLLRAAVAAVPSMAHPDEIFQYIEQAHRLVFGYGLIPWEYRDGIRSWVPPLALAPLMQLGEWAAPDTNLYLFLPKLLVAFISLLVPVSAYMLGARLSRRHAMVALVVAATWSELVYFGGHVLTETAATSFILLGAALLMSGSRQPRKVAFAGALLGLGAVLRFHYLPAIGVFILMVAGKDFKGTWLPLIIGGVPVLAFSALTDVNFGQAPFAWMLENFRHNIVYNRSAEYGVSGPLAYFTMYVRNWGPLPLLLLILALAPAVQRYRPLFWMAITNLAVHSMIGHKEYRFVLLTTAILLILAAIGSVEWLRRWGHSLPAASTRAAFFTLALLWTGLSASLALAEPLHGRWFAFRPNFESAVALRSVPKLCGVGFYELRFWESGGYSYLHRPVPLYLVQTPYLDETKRDLATVAPSFNAIIAPEDRGAELAPDFRKLRCSSVSRKGRGSGSEAGFHRVCAFVRSGTCDPSAAQEQRMGLIMRRRNQ